MMTFDEIQKLMDLSKKVQRARFDAEDAKFTSIAYLASYAVDSFEDNTELVAKVRAVFVEDAERRLAEAVAEAKEAGVDTDKIPPMIGAGFRSAPGMSRVHVSSDGTLTVSA
jgi:hypothetical protein